MTDIANVHCMRNAAGVILVVIIDPATPVPGQSKSLPCNCREAPACLGASQALLLSTQRGRRSFPDWRSAAFDDDSKSSSRRKPRKNVKKPCLWSTTAQRSLKKSGSALCNRTAFNFNKIRQMKEVIESDMGTRATAVWDPR